MKKNNKDNNTEKKETVINLPDVKDIPGQEHIHPPKMNAMVDATPSSDDEEGKAVFDEEENQELSGEDNVTSIERKLLEESDRPVTDEDRDLEEMALDSTDEDGEPLDEGGNALDMGEDLDIPGSELDDDDEELGEEDEENNSYSGRD